MALVVHPKFKGFQEPLKTPSLYVKMMIVNYIVNIMNWVCTIPGLWTGLWTGLWSHIALQILISTFSVISLHCLANQTLLLMQKVSRLKIISTVSALWKLSWVWCSTNVDSDCVVILSCRWWRGRSWPCMGIETEWKESCAPSSFGCHSNEYNSV